jgi:hypothetical protein
MGGFGLVDALTRTSDMCQQWFSVTGLIFDAAGFLLIAFEWRHVFLA